MGAAKVSPAASRLMRMRQYLARLPEGELSYAQCQTRAGLFNISLDKQPFALPADAPQWLHDFVATRKPATTLIPIVQVNAWVFALIDVAFEGDVQRYLRFNYDVNRAFGTHPMYSLLYRMLSPSFVMTTMPMAFKRLMPGVSASVSAQDGGARVVLQFPKYLYDDTMVRGWGAAFEAMIENAGGKEPQIKVLDQSPTHVSLGARWT